MKGKQINWVTAHMSVQQSMTCDVRSRVAMCVCEPILVKLAMCMLAVHFKACDFRSQL